MVLYRIRGVTDIIRGSASPAIVTRCMAQVDESVGDDQMDCPGRVLVRE